MNELNCKVCDNSENNKIYNIKEMMFGYKDDFDYIDCSNCGCLQIAEIPENIEKFYPKNYYSFKKQESKNFMFKIIKKKRDEYAFLKKGLLGRLVYWKYPNLFIDVLNKLNIDYNSKILDVGCGAGNLLYDLNEIGFKNLVGVDLYVQDEVRCGNIKIHKNTIHKLPDGETFDLIISNHSFEHFPDQLSTLLKIYKLLSKNGFCLISMPIKTEYIWNLYGTNWVQIDAPRHFYIHTFKSFELLLKKSGLVIQDVIFNSTEFQFWGSEQYKHCIPLNSEKSYNINPKKSIFTRKEIEKFKKEVKRLNKIRQADQAIFILTKIGEIK